MNQKKILILFAHPRLERSKINKRLLTEIPFKKNITFHDLYQVYPDFNIHVEHEKQLLLEHEIVIWQHPFYWYSCPPLLKQWIDMVLDFGWAYGPGGNALKGKWIFNSITTGGAPEAYMHEGRNRFTVREFLAPFDQTAHLCQMLYLPPFCVMGTHRLNDEQINQSAEEYHILLEKLSNNEFDIDVLRTCENLNQLCTAKTREI